MSGSFDAHGVKITYSVNGKGEPVVLIHGWASSGWLNWDLPGTTRLWPRITGSSGWICRATVLRTGRQGGSVRAELVEHIVRLMDHLKIKKAHIVGYSMGGIITAKFLAKHPDRALSGTLGGMGGLWKGA